jgi:protein gp37
MTTEIEWARNADGTKGETWNPTTGCDRVSPGCDNCYALKLAGRLKRMGQAKYQRDGDPRTSGPGFGLTLHPDALDIPLRRKKPTTWFVDSMSDLFHPEVPDGFIAWTFHNMALASHHTFQVLTKRPQRMAEWVQRWEDRTDDNAHDANGMPPMPRGPESVRSVYTSGRALLFADMLDQWGEPPEGAAYPLYDWMEGPRRWMSPAWNVWLGTSIENDRYTWRADHLRATPAAVRFVSLEPLLGPVPSLNLGGINWVITGGESGPNARPLDPDWVRGIRDRCQEAGVAFFHKQNGGRTSKAGGRELDGRTWDEMPQHAGAVA